jgi:hypothetical protein
MNDKLVDQTKATSGFIKIFMAGIEIFLGLLFLLYSIVALFVFLLSIGLGAFLISGLLTIMFISLTFAIFLARRERTMLFPLPKKFAIAALLILLTAINVYYAVTYIDYFLAHSLLQRDSALYLLFIVFVITSLASLWYFLYQKFPAKHVVITHFLIALLVLVFVVLQLTNVRKNQALVLATYQEFGQAINQRNFEAAYQLMSPDYRQKHTIEDLISSEFFMDYATEHIDSIYAVEYNIWSHRAHIVVDSGFTATLWRRPEEGISLDFKYVDGKWLLTGQTSFYLID